MTGIFDAVGPTVQLPLIWKVRRGKEIYPVASILCRRDHAPCKAVLGECFECSLTELTTSGCKNAIVLDNQSKANRYVDKLAKSP